MRRSDREITDKVEITAILSRCDVCHLALIDTGKPYVVPLNFGFEWEGDFPVLYFHCASAGRKLDIIRRGGEACFVADTDHELVSGEQGCDWGMKYSSVMGTGTVEIVEDVPTKKKALDLLMFQYTKKSGFSYDERVFSRTTVLRMACVEVSAKKKG